MKNIRLLGIALLIVMLGTSCMSYKNIEKVKPISAVPSLAEEIQKLKAGDKIKVYQSSGEIKNLRYVTTENGVLRGFEPKKTSQDLISIKVEDIDLIHVNKINVTKTIWRTGLTTGLVVSVIIFGWFIFMGSQAS
jgi:hypothetical protein